MDAALDRLVSSAAGPGPGSGSGSGAEPPGYLPSPAWDGPRAGYYFGTAERGTGYYLDGGAGADAGGGSRKKRLRFAGDGAEAKADADADAASPHASGEAASAGRRRRRRTGEELLAEAEEALAAGQRSLGMGPGGGGGGGGGVGGGARGGAAGVRAAASALSRLRTTNEMERAANPDDPARFLRSEVLLNDAVTAVRDAAADGPVRANYGALAGSATALPDVVDLLGQHPNPDLAATAASVLAELLDPSLAADERREAEEEAAAGGGRDDKGIPLHPGVGLAAGAALAADLVDALGSALSVFAEGAASGDGRQGDALGDVLAVAEHLLDLDLAGALPPPSPPSSSGSVAASLLGGTTVLPWLVRAAAAGGGAGRTLGGDAVSLHASEVLSALLQRDEARTLVPDLARLPRFRSAADGDGDGDGNGGKGEGKEEGDTVEDGMELLLQAIAPYRRRDPGTAEEVEGLENVLDALCAALQSPPTAEAFLERQGVELMLRCLGGGGHSGAGAARVLGFATAGPVGEAGGGNSDPYRRACEVLVEAGGLKQIFPLFMGRAGAIPAPAACSDAGRGLALARKRAGGDADGADAGKESGGRRRRRKKADAARREWLREVEDSSVQILYALTRHLNDRSPNEARRRLLAKFLEGDCVSVDSVFFECSLACLLPPLCADESDGKQIF